MLLDIILAAAALVVTSLALYLALAKSVDAQQFRSSLRETFGALWKTWCWFYIIPWRLWYRVRNALAQTLIVIVTLVSFFVVAESSLVLLHHKEVLKYVPRLSQIDAKFLELPLWADVLALVLAAVLSWHHVSEWKSERRKEELPEAISKLLRPFGRPAKTISSMTDDEKQVLFDSLIKAFRKVLELRRKWTISASLMEEKIPGKLSVTLVHEADSRDKLNKALVLDVGTGGAGLAYKGPVAVYIPSVTHLVGIDAETVVPVGLYHRSDPPEPFRSVLCIPVVGQSKVVAVLTFTSRKRNAFGPSDYQIMRLAAGFVAFFFN